MIELALWVASAQAAVTVSRLAIRDVDAEIFSRLSESDARARLLTVLEASGVEAVGKDDALFGTDAAERARFVLGGSVESVARVGTQVEVAIEWRLFDRSRAEVIYTVTTTGYVARAGDVHDLVIAAVDDAVGRLVARERFREIADAGLEPDLPAVVDVPDGSRLRAPEAAAAPKERRGPARALTIAGGAALGGGVVVVGTTALVAGSATWMSDAGWAGLVTTNTAGWLLAVSGAAALTTGLVLVLDGAAVGVGPTGVLVAGRF